MQTLVPGRPPQGIVKERGSESPPFASRKPCCPVELGAVQDANLHDHGLEQSLLLRRGCSLPISDCKRCSPRRWNPNSTIKHFLGSWDLGLVQSLSTAERKPVLLDDLSQRIVQKRRELHCKDCPETPERVFGTAADSKDSSARCCVG